MTVDRYRELCAAASLERAARLQHRARLLRPLGRATARASRCTGKTSPARRRRCTFWDLQQQANRLSQRAGARSASRRGDKVALILPQRPETAIAHIAVLPAGRGRGAAVVPVRPRGARIPAAATRRRKVAIVDPQSLPNLAPIRDRLPRLAHVDRRRRRARGVASTPWDALLAAGVARTSTPVDDARRRSGAPHLHERHDRAAEGRADAAAVPARQPAGLRRIRTTASRSPATCSGRRPTGRGPAA